MEFHDSHQGVRRRYQVNENTLLLYYELTFIIQKLFKIFWSYGVSGHMSLTSLNRAVKTATTTQEYGALLITKDALVLIHSTKHVCCMRKVHTSQM
jgi:hypothetical protein